MKKHLLKSLALAAVLLVGGGTAKAGDFTDVTSTYLTNAALTTSPATDGNGWTVTTTSGIGSTNSSIGTSCGAFEFYHSYWGTVGSAIGTTMEFTMTQSTSATLPAGRYKISWQGYYREGENSYVGTTEKAYYYVKANSSNIATVKLGTYPSSGLDAAVTDFTNGTYPNEMTFTLTEAATVEIGLSGYIDTYRSWCVVGPVTLSQESLTSTDLTSLISEAEAFVSANMLSDDTKTTLNSAITTAGNYTESTDETEITSAITTLQVALDAANSTIIPADGYYYLKSNSTSNYVFMGNDYGTRASLGEFGNAVRVVTSNEFVTKIQLTSRSDKYLFEASTTSTEGDSNGTVYCDNTYNAGWTLEATDGGYYIKNNSTGNYLNDGGSYLAAGSDKSVFSLVSGTDYVAYLDGKDDALAATAATAANLSNVTTEAALEEYLDKYATAGDVTTVNSTDAEFFSNGTYAWGSSENVSTSFDAVTLPAGLYKIQAQAFARISDYASVVELLHPNNADKPAIYLYATVGETTSKTCLMSMADEQQTTSYTGNLSFSVSGYTYPNNTTGAGEMFDAGYYDDNVIYLYLSEESSVTIGIAGYCQTNRWTMYGDITVTPYTLSNPSVDVAIGADKYATRIFPFDYTLPTGIEAYSCETVSGTTLNLTPESSIVANTPYILHNTSTEADYDQTWTGAYVAPGTTLTAGLLTGMLEAAYVPAGSYVLQTQSDVQGFYQVAEDNTITAPAYRAYLTVENNEARAFTFGNGSATAINAIEALTSGNAEIYDLSGRKLSKLQKGVNIVNGQKVIVK